LFSFILKVITACMVVSESEVLDFEEEFCTIIMEETGHDCKG